MMNISFLKGPPKRNLCPLHLKKKLRRRRRHHHHHHHHYHHHHIGSTAWLQP
jgi:hypothetical protein